MSVGFTPTCLVPKAPFKDMDSAYYLRMVNAVYAIDDFPGDALLWRIRTPLSEKNG
jgi:hypothetical protein